MNIEDLAVAHDIVRTQLDNTPASEDGLELLALADYTLKLLLDKMED